MIRVWAGYWNVFTDDLQPSNKRRFSVFQLHAIKTWRVAAAADWREFRFFFTPNDMLRHWGQLSIFISLSTVTYLDFSPRMTGFSNRVVHVECVRDRLKMLPYLLHTLGFLPNICCFNDASSSHIIRDSINNYFCRTRGIHLIATSK
jgi:hypothetical protein